MIAVDIAPTGVDAPTFPGLVNAELRRLLARRFARFTLALSLIGFVVAIAFIWVTHSQVTPDDTAQATAARDQQIVQIQQYVDDCLKVPGGSAEQCGQAPTAEQFSIDQFLNNHPFRPEMVADYSMAVGIAAAMAGFLIAATFIGAEWSSKSFVSWLFYEPRRLRLLGAKIVALCSVLLPLALARPGPVVDLRQGAARLSRGRGSRAGRTRGMSRPGHARGHHGLRRAGVRPATGICDAGPIELSNLHGALVLEVFTAVVLGHPC
jgi:hypothetical protein